MEFTLPLLLGRGEYTYKSIDKSSQYALFSFIWLNGLRINGGGGVVPAKTKMNLLST